MGHPTESSATSMRTWTSGRGGPPARDTSTPPLTAGRECLPPSPAHLTTTTAQLEKVTSTGNPRSTNGMVICLQQPRAKQVKTSARPPSTAQPTHQTPTMLRSLSTGPTMGPPKCPEPEGSHLEERKMILTEACISSRVGLAG